MNDTQPGQLIVPHGPEEPAPIPNGAPGPERPEQPEAVPPSPTPAPEPVATNLPVDPVALQSSRDAAELASWQTNVSDTTMAGGGMSADDEEIEWTASESADHSKGIGWYGALALVAVLVIAGIYWLTKDKITAGVVAVVMVGFGVYAGRRPHVQQYSLGEYGIRIGNKVYGLHEFKAFSVAHEGPAVSVMLLPFKRFMPSLTVYLDPQLEQRILAVLSTAMPVETHQGDALESLMRRIHF